MMNSVESILRSVHSPGSNTAETVDLACLVGAGNMQRWPRGGKVGGLARASVPNDLALRISRTCHRILQRDELGPPTVGDARDSATSRGDATSIVVCS